MYYHFYHNFLTVGKEMKTSLKTVLVIIMLVASGVTNQANSSMGSLKSCLHNHDQYAQVAPNQSCSNLHAGHTHPDGWNPDDCLLEEFIVGGEIY